MLAGRDPVRYSEIRREMRNITDAVLAANLKDLIKEGIVLRKSYDEIPPRVEYTLTEKGKTVVPVLIDIAKWAAPYFEESAEGCSERACHHCGVQKKF